ncbi:hypothetical protein ACJ8PU_09125 [Serratia sp. CY81489]|uniref:hypothetical protein n=1 Tax=unclassified Serratia (in: enterobacteria) TaxID=2647522 RepID=UPI003F9ECD4C
MTLTTEQLRARAESLGLDFFIERRSGIWVKEWLNDGCTSATDEEVMMWSMLANLEAQPVALVDRRPAASGSICWQNGGKDLAHGTELFTAPPAPANAQSVAWEMRYWNSGHNCWHDWERITAEQHAEMSVQHAADNDYDFRVLYDAPPAPAVPDGYCVMPLTLTAANGAKGALSGEFKVSRTVRCHECGGEGCDDCADAGEFEEEITVPWDTIKDIYRAAVDACRAAMLAAAPEGGK